MTTGTKSVLFGAHAFWLHPWFVALGWWKLYGFPWDPRLWVAFFVHDLGYLGLEKMDDDQGELHPWAGALAMAIWLREKSKPRWPRRYFSRDPAGNRIWDADMHMLFLDPDVDLGKWGRFVLRHSRFLCKRYGMKPSRLCFADKLAIALTPAWIYVPMALLTGEIHQYMGAREASGGRISKGWERKGDGPRDWYARVRQSSRRWVEGHLDGRKDTWTPEPAR